MMFMFCTAPPCHPGRLPRQGRGRLTFQRPQGASGAGAGQSSSPVVSGNPSMMFMFWTAAPACHPGRLPRQGRGRLTFQRPQGASGAGAGQSSSPVVSGNPSMMFMFWTAAPACHPGRLPRQGRGRLTFQRPQGASGAGAGQSSSPVVSGNPSMMFMFWTAAPEAPFPRLSKRAVTVNASSFPATTRVRSFSPAFTPP